MELRKILSHIQEPEMFDEMHPFWQESMATMPKEKTLPFLKHDTLKESSEFAGFSPEICSALCRMADQIGADENLRKISWYIDWRNFEAKTDKDAKWPELKMLGDDIGLFWLVMSLAWVPRLREYHKKLKVPEQITRDTSMEIYSFSLNYKLAKSGKIGMFERQYFWFRKYLADNLYFRIGRFEYWLKPFDTHFTVFRHKENNKVVALAKTGLKVTSEGFIDALTECSDKPEPWETTLEIDADKACGYRIKPEGVICPDKITLPLSEWKIVLKPGDNFLDMHIPAGGKMGLDVSGESMRDAFAFFNKYFPDSNVKAIVCCGSWMFSPLLEKALPDTSNLVKYLQELYLFPILHGGTGALWFVFFQDKFDHATAPRDTSLQRALLDYLEPGRVWHSGGMFYLADDIDKFGTQVYRSQTL